MQQKRLLIALVLSSTILLGWSYFFPPAKPTQNAQPGASPSPSSAATVAPAAETSNANPTQSTPLQVANLSAAPKRTITIKTPLYTVQFETLGAEPVSWVIASNKNSQKPIYSVAGTRQDRIPLELIDPEGRQRQPRLVPLQLHTGDSALDELLRSATYRVEGVDSADGDVLLDLTHGQ